MKYLYFLIIFLCSCFYSSAQDYVINSTVYDIPVLQADKINVGFYKSYEEFINNSPKYPVTAEFRNPNNENLYYVKQKQKKSDVVIHNDTLAADAELFLYSMWGYSDGEYLYLRSSNSGILIYIKSGKIGRFTPINIPISTLSRNLGGAGTILRGIGMAGVGLAASTAGLVAVVAHNPHHVIDVASNSLIKLNKKSMRAILYSYPELLQRYNKIIGPHSENIYAINEAYLKAANEAYKRNIRKL